MVVLVVVMLAATAAAGEMFTLTDQQEFLNGSLVNVDPDSSPGDLKLGTSNSTDSSLVGFWRLDQAVSGSGGTVQDYSGNSNAGTTRNGVTTGVEGVRSSQAFSFDGTDDYIEITGFPSIESSITVSAWVKSTAGDTYTAPWSTVSRYDQFILGPRSGEMSFIVYTPSDGWTYLDPPPTPNKDKWHHFVGTWNADTGTLRLWMDGKLHAENTTYTPDEPAHDAGPVDIGHREGNAEGTDHLQAKIDNVQIYSRALTRSEIQQLYDPSPGFFTSSLINGGGARWVNTSWQETLESNTDLEARIHSLNQVNVTDSFNEWAQGDGFWKYRKPITITEQSGQALDSYTVQLSVDTASYISQGRMKPNCADIRFWSPSSGLLDYWLQEYTCNTDSTHIFVELSHLAAGSSKTIYMYYANPGASTKSNNEEVVDFSQAGTYIDSYPDGSNSYVEGHGAGYAEGNFYTSDHEEVNRFSSGWSFQQQYTDTEIYTGICYDRKRDHFYVIDWDNKEWSAWTSSFNEITSNGMADNHIGDEPIDCGTDGKYVYTNHRNGLICRNSIASNAKSCIDMSSLTGITWGGQGLVYAYGYLFAGLAPDYGSTYHRIYAIDISDWNNPTVKTYWNADGHGLTETAGLAQRGKFIYETSRSTDTALQWQGPFKHVSPSPTISWGTEQKITAPQSFQSSTYISRWFTGKKNWLNWQGSGGQPLKPMAQWRFDEGTGQEAIDSAGEDQNAVLGSSTSSESSDPVWQQGCRFNGCIQLDGSDDFVSTFSYSLRDDKPFSMSFWINLNSYTGNENWQSFVSTHDNDEGFSIQQNQPDDTPVRFGMRDTSGTWHTATADNFLDLNRWYHITGVYTGSRTVLYVNGEKKATSNAFTVQSSNKVINIGRSAYYDEYTPAEIDDFRFYNHSLSPEQVQALYNSPSQSWQSIGFQVRSRQSDPTLSSLVASYSFEGTGQSVMDSSEEARSGVLGNDTKESYDPQRVEGYSGQGLDFHESSDSSSQGPTVTVTQANVPTMDMFTISAWVKPRGTSNYGAVVAPDNSCSGTETEWMAGYRDQNGNIGFWDGGIITSTAYTSDQWQHLTMVATGSQMLLYRNGQQVDSASYSGTIRADQLFLGEYECGSGSDNWNFNGRIDEVRIYSEALSQSEVQQLYNLSDFTDPLTKERGQYFDAPNTNAAGQTFEENYYQYKINFLTGDSSSIPQVEKVVMANASDWSPWFTDPSGNTLNIPDGLYAQIQTKFTSTAVLNTSVLHEIKLLSNFDPKIVATPNPVNSSDTHSFTVEAEATDFDGEGELVSCTLFYDDRDGNTGTVSGTIDQSYGNSTEVQCSPQVDSGLPGIQPGETVETRVQFTDVLGVKVNTSLVTNIVPNRKPKIHPPIVTFPSDPDVFDNVTTRVNTSDPEDPVRYANFTVWEYTEDTANRLFFNRNGTMWRNGTYQLWNATEFQADLENATYNFSLTVSDGYAEVSRSGKLFTLEAVRPEVSRLSFYRPSPWNIEETWFRPGQGVGAYVTVTDANGRGDIVGYGGQVIEPNGQVFTVSSFDVENRVLNGYNLSIFYSVPDDAVSGDWDMRITATDGDALQESNRSTFHVTSYNSVTASVEQSLQNDTVYVDGSNVGDGVYTDSEVTFPYAVRVWRRLLTGVINYGRFTQLTVAGDVLSMQQQFADNQFLLPVTEASVFDLEQLEDEFTGSLLSERSFLEHAVASIGYGTTDEKTVRVAARFAENERIQIRGFQGSLSSGIHQLLIEKHGVEKGSTVVSVELVR